MNTDTSPRRSRFLVFFAVLIAFGLMSMTSCRHGRTGQQGEPGMNGNDGTDGQDGQDGGAGNDGLDGLDGMGFFFVRGISGSELVGDYWYGDAECVVPEQILSIAPAEGKKAEGVILYLGTLDSPFRYYLIEDLAIVELAVLQALGLLEAVIEKGAVVESEGTETLEVKKSYVRIGALKIRLNDKHDEDDDN